MTWGVVRTPSSGDLMVLLQHVATEPSRRRLLLLAVVGGLLLAVGCSSGRSRARLVEIIEKRGSTTSEYDFRYDDANRLDEVRVDTGALDKYIYKYDDQGRVEEIDFERDGADDIRYEFTYDDSGRLKSKKESSGNTTTESDISYSDAGDVDNVERFTRIGDNTTIDTDHILTRNDSGLLIEWEERVKTIVDVPLIGDVESTTSTTREFEYGDEGYLEEIVVTYRSGDDTDIDDVDFKYDDQGRLETFTTEANNNADIDYDDSGRIAEIDYSDVDLTFEFSYDEGSADGAILEPIGMPYRMFFDLEGKSYSAFDLNSQSVLLGF